jgi:hypothetical protein
MLKAMMLAGVTLLVTVILVVRYDKNFDTGSVGYSVECQQSSQPPSAAASLACKIYSTHEADQDKSNPPWWYKLLAWPEGITAWLLILTLGAIVWQAWETRKAAIASEVAAAASLKQANHLIASERAWVMAELRFEHSGLFRGDDGTAFGGQTMASVILSIKNSGPTPAWVYEQFIHLDVSPEIITSLGTYPSPNFPFIGEGKESFVSYEIHPISQGDDPVGTGALVRDDGVPTPENGLHTYIFGVVRYRDAFSLKRETYFGYSVKGRRLERIPNEAYNKHT